jgi:excisionase family DNA binding protein
MAPTATSSQPLYLTTEEVAERARASVATVRYWMHVGKLASSRPGRRRLVRDDVLTRFLDGEQSVK